MTADALGGALAVAVFGSLQAAPAGMEAGICVSLLLAAVAAAAALIGVAGLGSRH